MVSLSSIAIYWGLSNPLLLYIEEPPACIRPGVWMKALVTGTQRDDIGLLGRKLPGKGAGVGRMVESRRNMDRPDILGGSPFLPLGWNRPLFKSLSLEHSGLPRVYFIVLYARAQYSNTV